MRWLTNSDFEEIDPICQHFPIEKLGGTLGYNAYVNYKFPGGVVANLQTSGAVAQSCSTSVLEVIGDNTRSIKANWNNELTLFGEDPDIQALAFPRTRWPSHVGSHADGRAFLSIVFWRAASRRSRRKTAGGRSRSR